MRVRTQTIAAPEWGIPFTAARRADVLAAATVPAPQIAIVPLLQHTGAAAEPLVSVGDTLLRGQPIGSVREQQLGARVHAPIAGIVTDVRPGPVPGRRDALRVHIENDGSDAAWPDYARLSDPLRLSTSALRQAVIEAGIVGLGGATFPAGLKLNRGSGVHTLILNAAECEPVISCDETLLHSDSDLMLLGAQVMMRILEADTCVIALKQGMTDAQGVVTAAIDRLNDDRFQLALVPAVYPVGGEQQLIQMITGEEIPTGGLPWDSGAICQNVGTAAAIARFLTQGEPLISRIVTVTGAGVREPGNFIARIGTPVSDLIAAAGGYSTEPPALIMGGPMMGVDIANDTLPVTKAMNCIYVPDSAELRSKPEPVACIRCGDCSQACPAGLMPQLLLQTLRTSDYDRASELGLSDCIECGCCDYVCPSHIPLTRGFVQGKQQLWQIGFEKQRADLAARRYAAREKRLADVADQPDPTAVNLHDVADGDSARNELDALLQRIQQQQDDDR